jgi:carbon storage regulator
LLGNDITVTVLSVDGDRVKLGVTAPRHITVLRQEIFNQVQSANAGAASAAARPALADIAAALRNR